MSTIKSKLGSEKLSTIELKSLAVMDIKLATPMDVGSDPIYLCMLICRAIVKLTLTE